MNDMLVDPDRGRDPIETGFRAEITAGGRRFDVLPVFADWLEERERHSEAFLFRWLAARQKWPHERLTYPHLNGPSRKVPQRYRWGWYSGAFRLPSKPPEASVLPHPVFLLMPGASLLKAHLYLGCFWEALDRLRLGLNSLKDHLRV